MDSSPRWLPWALAAAILGLQILGFHGHRQDDAYITYRYGQNLATGHGLVFNPGERIMGSTSPGHALLSAGVYLLVGPERLPDVLASFGCLGWTAQALALFFLFRNLLGIWGALAVAAGVALGGPYSSNWVSLETNLAVGLTLWAVTLALRGRWSMAAILGALAGLFRPDAYLICVLLGLQGLFERRSAILKPALVFLVLSLPWMIFATAYFGSPVPQSAITKFHAARFGEYLEHLLRYPAWAFLPGLSPTWIGIVFSWILAAGGAVILIRSDRRLWILPAYGALHFLAYLYLRPMIPHLWHLYPGVVMFVVLALVSFVAAIRAITQPLPRAVIGVLLGTLLFGYGYRTVASSLLHDSVYWTGERDKTYQAVSSYLREHAAAGDVVASMEVGTIGYYSGLRMFDLGGLITRLPDGGGRTDGPRTNYQWMVTDPFFLSKAPPQPPEVVFQNRDFIAYVFHLKPAAR